MANQRTYTVRGFNSNTGNHIIQWDDDGTWGEIDGKHQNAVESQLDLPKAMEPADNKMLEPGENKARPRSKK